MKNILVGEKYYRYISENEYEIIIIKKILEDNNIIIIDNNGHKKNISKLELDEYILLIPDGYLFFTIVNMKDSKDVVVYLVRNIDIEQKSRPFCACRQCIVDIFTDMTKQNEDIFYMGLSMSIESCPKDVDYSMILACDSVEYSERVAYYIEDRFNDIFKLIKNRYKFNHILLNYYNNMDKNIYKGFTHNLKSLLLKNDFMYDVHYGYDIYEVDFEIKLQNEYELIPEQRLYLENTIKYQMFKTYVTKYNRTIDISKIQRNYVLVWSLKTEELFIVGYDEGKYINPYIKEQFKNIKDQVGIMRDYIKKL